MYLYINDLSLEDRRDIGAKYTHIYIYIYINMRISTNSAREKKTPPGPFQIDNDLLLLYHVCYIY